MEAIEQLLRNSKTIAVVGLSSKPFRPSHGVAEYLQHHGYRIIPVNPEETEVLGEKAYHSLAEAPGPIDIVNIFRRPEYVPDIVDAAISRGAKAVWMQEEVIHAEAAERARQAGLFVVMDRCIAKEHRRLIR
ncbi:MAG TPA: CoA-binding protein [Bryobacteraceae bacterium]|jgi:predicted CoA-binding protein|nr:CoA-binding protein [Bryobacteraceae bacterium]